jgi:DNA-binding NarL/FixJ family response regulator
VKDRYFLSERELEILNLLAQGKNNREIAREIHLTEGTVKNHITQILCQLEVRDRTQAALWAQRYLSTERPSAASFSS